MRSLQLAGLRTVCAVAVTFSFTCSVRAQSSTPCPGSTALSSVGSNTFCCSTGVNGCCTPVQNGTGPSVGLPGYPTTITTTNFGSNFVAGSQAPNYEVDFPTFQVGASGAGDYNARYGAIYYNIGAASSTPNSMLNWANTCGGLSTGCSGVTPTNPNALGGPAPFPYCSVELVVAGQYPNARYFSIANYDEHYTNAQHLADVDVDPLTSTSINPYSLNNSWSYMPYVAPVSLGTVPGSGAQQGSSGTLTGCQISPYEEDNLLDGTQRHPAADWNGDVIGTPGLSSTPNANFPSQSHTTDGPLHANTTYNPAGSIHVRTYLSPPYTCNGNVGSTLDCSLPSGSYFPDNNNGNTFYIVRDTYTGCAYTNSSVNNTMLVGSALSTYQSPFLSQTPMWQNSNQMTYHSELSEWTPQLCYANGNPNPPISAPFGNRVVWSRTPNHVAGQAPDDAYISGSISASALNAIINGGACNNPSDGNACAIRLRFQIPPMPATPCQPTPGCTPPSCTPSSTCTLPMAQSALRYSSMTIGYQPPGINNAMVTDIDGQNPALTGPNSYSIVSLADAAFNMGKTVGASGTYPAHFVNVILNVNPNFNFNLPVGIAYNSATVNGYQVNSTPILTGVGPIQPLANYNDGTGGHPHYYSAWLNTTQLGGAQVGDSYVVVDLAQFGDFYSPSTNDSYAACSPNMSGIITCNHPLILTMRSTLLGPDPNNTNQPFPCSGFSVPYLTAEYTNSDGNGGGFMGPYVPLVDYPAIGTLNCGNSGQPTCTSGALLPPPPAIGTSNLPSYNSCGQFPGSVIPLNNFATSSNQNQYPTQYWPQ